jgi:hypothetical protein
LKQLKNYVLLLQIQGENDKNLEIFPELSKPQNWSKFITANSGKLDTNLGEFAKLSQPQTFKGLENSIFLL